MRRMNREIQFENLKSIICVIPPHTNLAHKNHTGFSPKIYFSENLFFIIFLFYILDFKIDIYLFQHLSLFANNKKNIFQT